MQYIVKVRERAEWVTETVKGLRRVRCWTKWRVVIRYPETQAQAAFDWVENHQRMGGLGQVAVFHGGKRAQRPPR